jgi:hypothetical protein
MTLRLRPSRILLIIFFAAGSVIMAPASSSAHARLKPQGLLTPRSTNSGLKTGPCGGVPRTTTSKSFQAGQLITVEWEETINHPGYFEFYFSPANDTGWILLKSVVDDQNGTADLPHSYSTTLTLPNTPCSACTIQMIQVMTENPASPSLYYSCADIELTAGSGLPTPTPVATPVQSPIDPNCN